MKRFLDPHRHYGVPFYLIDLILTERYKGIVTRRARASYKATNNLIRCGVK
jgi:hypothetical protein